MAILMTSLDEIKSFQPCTYGWKDILKGQGKTESDSVLFPLKDALKSNSFGDVCWLLGKRKIEISICVRAARMCADSVAHLKVSKYAAADAYAYADAYAAADAYAYAYAAAYAAADAYAYADAYAAQIVKNKDFLLKAIEEYEASH